MLCKSKGDGNSVVPLTVCLSKKIGHETWMEKRYFFYDCNKSKKGCLGKFWKDSISV